MLTVMQETCCTFRVQKSVLVAAAASCLALGFVSPISVAVAADESDDPPLPFCPHPNFRAQAGESQKPRDDSDQAPVEAEADTPVLQAPADGALRVATYNANLTRDASGELLEELSAPGAEDAIRAARVIQTVRPDVLVLTGIDIDDGNNVAEAFNTNYLAVGGDDHTGITYPYYYTSSTNAGVDSGADLNRNGTIGDPGDALGYGDFPGDSSMIVYSQYPLDENKVRDFTSMPWKSMPDNSIPDEVTALERDILPLASVSHWDIPIEIDGETLHVLATSTADASESSYGTDRNHDQIRFWEDYIDADAEYIRDHRGERGPLSDDADFVIAGSLKADPSGKGPADPTAITSLLKSDQIIDPEPAQTVTGSKLSGSLIRGTTDVQHHTGPTPADNDETYRADYVLLSSDLDVKDSGVLETESYDAAQGMFGFPDDEAAHHLVWADVALGD